MPVDAIAPPKASWADEVEEEEDSFAPQIFTDENGIKTIIEYRLNDDGKKVKITRRIRTKLITEHVNKAVAERKKWAKFGEERDKKPGPDMSTTTVGENVGLKLASTGGKVCFWGCGAQGSVVVFIGVVDLVFWSRACGLCWLTNERWMMVGDMRELLPEYYVCYGAIWQDARLNHWNGTLPRNRHVHADIAAATAEEDPDMALKAAILKNKKILCRICKGDHFTTKCPYKGSLQPLDEIMEGKDATPDRAASPEPSTVTGPKKYVAPHMRGAGAGGSNTGESMGREKRDDSATIRVTNLSEDVTENDIHDLFRRFGQIARVYLARDRETNVCKGFAFVSFQTKDDAGRALQAINGYGYDNLILRVEWANSNK
ncbi:eukaryotic translation initiation factor 3 subunit G-domain-containing protein [Jimgerdemannia flammicorona]|uniref:Eukaryotic translation initiation factor 3 subunit G-domain-containing protein n=2 Tax=Jimgerdemannia flammicorona TaxID=994334 RepID=A0A433QQB4_9FUNG|nr:eukaryotic translation initiation factor 3 subunit G-domain-containing protein [Jimgerdemannia flammicorona]RUS31961.1 eukaryotic translation initiation factor 3 subunit G-domain-containing protein [Jimgerdemannia flammicorona]